MKNKVAIITGASRGIGLSIAKSIREEFDHIIMTARDIKSFKQSTINEFENIGEYHEVDFSNEKEVIMFARKIASQSTSIDLLVNNAGTYSENSILEESLDNITKMIDVNLKAPLIITKMLAHNIMKSESGMIINVSSIQASKPSNNLSVYAATKAGISTFGKVIRKELCDSNVRVITLEPYGVNTWNDPKPHGLLHPDDIGDLVRYLINGKSHIQLEEILISVRTPKK